MSRNLTPSKGKRPWPIPAKDAVRQPPGELLGPQATPITKAVNSTSVVRSGTPWARRPNNVRHRTELSPGETVSSGRDAQLLHGVLAPHDCWNGHCAENCHSCHVRHPCC